MIPAMHFLLGGERFGPGSLHLYKLAALTAAVVLSAPAALRHQRAGAVVSRFLPSIVALGALGVALGVGLAALFSGEATHVLRRVFGGVLALIVAATVWTQRRAGGPTAGVCPAPTRWAKVGTLVGLPSGLLSGLLGIGGGVWAGPVQHLLLGLRLRNAIANSTCMIAFLAPIAALAQALSVIQMGDLNVASGFWLALCLAPGAALGGWCGAWATHVLPLTWLRHLFHVTLLIAGVRLLIA
jgi:hypothetical protein